MIVRLVNISSGSDAYGPTVFLAVLDIDEERPFVSCRGLILEDEGVEGSMADVLREVLGGSCPLEVLRELTLATIGVYTRPLELRRRRVCVLRKMNEGRTGRRSWLVVFVDRVGRSRHVAVDFGNKYFASQFQDAFHLVSPQSISNLSH